MRNQNRARIAGLLLLAGEGVAQAQPVVPPTHDFGVLSGGSQSLPGGPITMTDQDVVWVQLTLSNDFDLTPPLSQSAVPHPLTPVTYLDITQVGSDVDVPWNFCLYDFGGLIIASSLAANKDGPSGPNNGSYAQLTFGVGPSRPLTPLTGGQSVPGDPLDNVNSVPLGNPTNLPPNSYFLAVTWGTTIFNPGFAASSTGPGGISATLNLTIDNDNRGQCPSAPADLNSDGAVDMADFTLFNNAYLLHLTRIADFDGDTVCDDHDYVLFVMMFSDFYSGC